MVSREPVLLIVAADRRELGGIARLASGETRARLGGGRERVGLEPVELGLEWARLGRLREWKAVLAANGAGRTNAAQVVQKVAGEFAIGGVVSTGLCGGLAPEIECGAVVVADRVISLSPAVEFAALRPRNTAQTALGAQLRSGAVLTVDYVVQSSGEKQLLHATGAVAVEMEAAGVAGEAQRRDLPFFCIKAVSDSVGESFRLDYNRARRADGRFSSARLVGQAGLNPGHWQELIGWRRRVAAGAHALGEFFREAEFES